MSNTENTELATGALSHLSVELGTLPALSDTQCWCCEMGCGDVIPKEIDFEYSRTEDIKTGRLIESLTEKRYVSPCCGKGLFAWDNSTDDEVLVDGKPLTA